MGWLDYTRLEFATATREFNGWVRGHVKSAFGVLVLSLLLAPLAYGIADLPNEVMKIGVDKIIGPFVVAAFTYLVFLGRAPVRIYNDLQAERASLAGRIDTLNAETCALNRTLLIERQAHAQALQTEADKRAAIMADEFDTGVKHAVYFWNHGQWPDGDPNLGVALMDSDQIVFNPAYREALDGLRAPLRTGKIKAWAHVTGDKSGGYVPIDPDKWATISIDARTLADDGLVSTNLFKDSGMGTQSMIYFDIKLSKAQVEAYRAIGV